ncbi:unnamed protein product [Parnassius mnemosyne]|uniref:CFA20 domain-containing protein n=1 Tax=Parnassius mnemosyne TaxID=213953 RepID=A0AAV1KNT9_9NEOP
MYRNKYQRGKLTIFYSVGSKPLEIWETHIKNGYVTRFLDQDIKSTVLEIGGTNISTTYISCPKGNQVLGITMPFLVMIVKNLKKYFSFEVTILDDTGTRRRFRVSNFQSTTQILPLCTVMPIVLADDWNQIQFNLAEFTRRAYNKQFVEIQKLKINANIRLRRVYFTEKLVHMDELPPEYKLYFPLEYKGKKESKRQTSKILELSESQKDEMTIKVSDASITNKVQNNSINNSKTTVSSITSHNNHVKVNDVMDINADELTKQHFINDDIVKLLEEIIDDVMNINADEVTRQNFINDDIVKLLEEIIENVFRITDTE